MQHRSRLLLAAFAATVFMALAVSDASARRIEISPKQTFLIKWDSNSQQLAFSDASAVKISCEVTLDGSFHSRTISKVSGQLVGYIYSTILREECNNTGHLRAKNETLPWHIQYNSFSGTLPNINGITLTVVGAKFRAEALGTTCDFATTQANPFFMRINIIATTHIVSGVTALSEHTIPLGAEPCFFASPGKFSGTGSMDEGYPGTVGVTIRLVA